MIQRRRKSIRTESGGGIGRQLLGLSLFVMLLAFFIVLNSISTFDEAKVEPMRQSLEETFAAKMDSVDTLRIMNIQAEERALEQGKTLERIEALLTANIAGTEAITSSESGIMYMRLPRTEFERVVTTLGAGERPDIVKPILETFISILRTDGRGIPYRVDITYNLDRNPGRVANREPQKMEEFVKAAAATAQTLEKAGLPARLMTIGLKKGNPDYIELMFTPMNKGGESDG